jgi:hypothetical protein
VDESETGSASFFGPRRVGLQPRPVGPFRLYAVHLRPPSIDRGVTSFLWAFGLALFIWLGLLGIGVHRGTALVVALLSFGAIFLYVRTQGGDT